MIDDLIERKNRKIPRHHFNDRPDADAGHRSTDSDACKSRFGDRRIDDALVAVFFPETLRYFIGAVILCDLFSHDENTGIALHLLIDRLINRFANLKNCHCRIFL